MKLNNKQKQYLLDNGYVTAKVLDAVVEPGWKNYFIKSFDWELAGKDRYGLERMYLFTDDMTIYAETPKASKKIY